jgi:hypothetical protein
MSTSVLARPEVAPTAGALPRSPLSPTIFHEPWWMEIVCNGAYRETTVAVDGVVIGRLPYKIRKQTPGLTVIGMPTMTHVLGPAIDENAGGNKLRRQIKNLGITAKLLAQLPDFSHISFRLHGDIADTLAFDAAGFESGVNYTVEIPPDSKEALWRQMRDKTRNIIRRAQEGLTIEESENAEEFLWFYENNLNAQNRYPKAISSKLVNNCISRQVGRILLARDPYGDIKAAVFCVWDARREYYFMSTRSDDAPSGAVSVLIWEAIQHASARGLIFDMYGIHVVGNSLPNIHLVTGFGGALKTRFTVRKSSRFVQVGRDLQTILKIKRSEL